MSTPKKLLVVVEDPAALADVALIFDRTAECLKACNQLTEVVGTQDENNVNIKQVEAALFRFTKIMLRIYPEGKCQCIADQKMFRGLQIAKELKN
jgi:hypothetical protein